MSRPPLSETHPALAAELIDGDATKLTRGTHAVFTWRCQLGHQWQAAVNTRVSGRGCPYCSNTKVLVGFNDLKTKFPELASEAKDWDPSTVLSQSNKSMRWECSFGHAWDARIQSRFLGRGCPYCSGSKVLQGFNDLATTHPQLAKELTDGDPRTITKGSGRKFSWRCDVGHSWKATVHDRTSGYGCPYCSGNKVLQGFNDLATTHPQLAKELTDGDPRTITKGSGRKFSWRCDVGHSWKATVHDRTSGYGCPSCSIGGFDPNKDGFLYFLEHEEWNMLQIGITNDSQSRLASHSRLGWKPLELRGPMDGHLAQQWETAILRMLKANGADLANSSIAGKFDGYSEAWSKATVMVKSIKELMQRTEEFEEGKK